MADSVTLEFELTERSVDAVLDLRRQRTNGLFIAGFGAVLGVALIAFGTVGPRGVLAAAGAFLLMMSALVGWLWGVQVPKSGRARHARLVGPTRVEFDDWGIHYSAANFTERLEWSRVARIKATRRGWMLVSRPMTVLVVPAAAVPAEQADLFAGQLKAWSGKAYKAPRGGSEGKPWLE